MCGGLSIIKPLKQKYPHGFRHILTNSKSPTSTQAQGASTDQSKHSKNGATDPNLVGPAPGRGPRRPGLRPFGPDAAALPRGDGVDGDAPERCDVS